MLFPTLFIKYLVIISAFTLYNLLLLSCNLSANEFSSYQYSAVKQAGGITYEITNTQLNNQGLTLEGWAYIADSQHYTHQNDLDLYFMTHKINGTDKLYYQANINANYDMTDIENYQGSRQCLEEEFKKDAIECNYQYKFVGFSVTIPISDVKYPNRYSLFLFAHAKKSNEQYYTQVYAPGTNTKYQIENITYEFDSALDEVEMIVNNEQIIARTGPSKKYGKLMIDTYERYFKNGTTLKPIDKTADERITWYQVPVSPDETIINNHKLVTGSSGYREKMAYIASIYINHIGRGYAIISTYSNAEFKLESIMTPVINDQDFNLGYKVSTKNINEPTNIEVTVEYGNYKNTHEVIVEPHKTLTNYLLIGKEHIVNQEIKVSINSQNQKFNDNNLEDNVLKINPFITPNSTQNTELLKSQNQIKLRLTSGFEQTHEELIKYFENIIIDITPPIDHIPREWNEYDVEFTNFYSGGIFKYQLAYKIENQYPYLNIDIDNVTAFLNNNCQVIDIKDCHNVHKMELIKGVKQFNNPNFINNDGTIELSETTEINENKIYTKLDAETGIYPITIGLNMLGKAQINLIINSYIEIKGPILGANRNSLFYYRNISRDNPMPNYQSKIWKTKLDVIQTQNENFKKINLPPEFKTKIKAWIEENYQENINNDQLNI